MSDFYYGDYLAHHGVKGMKWGVRKDRKLWQGVKKGPDWAGKMPKDPEWQHKDPGLRVSPKRAAKAVRKIRQLETTRAKNKLQYEEMQAESRDIYSGPKKAKKLKKSLARDKALYDTTEVTNNYLIAKQKAKKDKSYKDTPEYKKAKTAFGKQQTQKLLYGEMGHQRIETLKNMGMSEKKAKGKVFAESALIAAGSFAALTGVQMAINKYYG